jgi:hypothetical protein
VGAVEAGILASLAAMVAVPAWADPIGDLVTFSPGTTARAAEINANFSTLADAINSNHAAINALSSLENHVVLVRIAPGNSTTPCTPNKEFRRMSPHGLLADDVFVVPAGMVLVVTDVEATIVAGTGSTFPQGRPVQAAVLPHELSQSAFAPQETAGVPITDTTSEAVSVSSALRTGPLIGAGQEVRVRGQARTASSGYLFYTAATAIVRGYLTEAPPAP